MDEKVVDEKVVDEKSLVKRTPLAVDDFNNHPSIHKEFMVPPPEAYTYDKMMVGVRRVWDKLDFGSPEGFKSIDQAIEYIVTVERECEERLLRAMSTAITVNGAGLARRWQNSAVINAVARTCSGEELRDRVCEALGIGVTEYYAVRDISNRFTQQEVYAFGMHGGTYKQLKLLATIADDSTRKKILTAYCEATSHVLDAHARSAANDLLCRSVEVARLSAGTELDVSDDKVSEVDSVPEYLYRALKEIARLRKNVVAHLTEGKTDTACETFLMVAGTETGVVAEQLLDTIRTEAKALASDLDSALEMCSRLLDELGSLSVVGTPEEAAICVEVAADDTDDQIRDAELVED